MILETEVYFIEQKSLIEEYIKQSIESPSEKLKEAMLYSTLNGGKRFRGILCLTSFDSYFQPLSENLLNIIPIAVGIEYIHAMSLIHDDLPCMDNDDFRRGKPTCHKQFNEAIALLAGDGLLIEGLNLFFKTNIAQANKLKCLEILLKAIGSEGMIGGQALDIWSQPQKDKLQTVEQIHKLKSAVFIGASCSIGVAARTLDEKYIQAFYKFGKNLGLAFQIIDDILDVTASSEQLGKTQGKDQEQNKITYPTVMGIEKSQKIAEELIQEAKEKLIKLEYIKTERLFELADLVIQRDK